MLLIGAEDVQEVDLQVDNVLRIDLFWLVVLLGLVGLGRLVRLGGLVGLRGGVGAGAGSGVGRRFRLCARGKQRQYHDRHKYQRQDHLDFLHTVSPFLSIG